MRTTVAVYVAVFAALCALCRWEGLNVVQTALLFAMAGAYVAALNLYERFDRIGPLTFARLRGIVAGLRRGRPLARVSRQVLPVDALDGKPLDVRRMGEEIGAEPAASAAVAEVVETRPWPRSVWAGRGGRR